MYVRGRPPWYRSVDHIHLLEGLRMAGCEDDCEPTSRRGSCRDVAGYSRLMRADEEGTLERLKTLRRDLLDPKISEHHRHIVKTTGDGMLVDLRASSMRSAARPQCSRQCPGGTLVSRRLAPQRERDLKGSTPACEYSAHSS
jgi:hypothetical protein